MEGPYFSIIIPTYNRCELLRGTLESVWAQTFTNYEVIVVDDGSTDGTWEYLQTLGSRVMALRQQNAGPGPARNLGIEEQATGYYVAFLDSDDLWFPWTLETFKKAIEECKHPAMVSGAQVDFTDVREVTSVKITAMSIKQYDDYLSSSADSLWLGVQGTVIRRDVLARVRFSPLNTNGEDNDLWLRLGVERGFKYIDSPKLFAYRRHEGSRVGDLRYAYAGARQMIKSEKNGVYPGGKQRTGERLEIIGRHLRPVVVSCVRNGLFKEAWKLYVSIFRWNIQGGKFRFLFGLPLLYIINSYKALGE